MKRFAWSATLALLAAVAGVATAPAQTGGVRPGGAEPATLGRPVAAAPPATLAPSVVRSVPPIEVVPVSYTAEKPRPIAVASTPGTTPPGPWPTEIHVPNRASEFAMDRPVTTVRTIIVPAGGRIGGEDALPAPRPPMPAVLPGTVVSEPGMLGQAMPGPVGDWALTPPPRPAPKGLLRNIWPAQPAPGVPCEGPCPVPCEQPCQPDCSTTCGYPAPTMPDCCWYDPGHRSWYLKGEYLLWWTKGYDVPPLVTTSPFNDRFNNFGFLGVPGTQVLSDDSVERGALSGGRFTVGYWLHCEDAVEVSGFFLSPGNESALFRGNQFPILARPFFSLNRNGGPFSQVVNNPGQLSGDIAIDSSMDFWGLEANYRCNACCKDFAPCGSGSVRGYRVDLLAGGRYLNLEEGLTIREDILGLPTNDVPAFRNQQITVTDSFNTTNRFYGGQVGVDAEWRHGRWSLGTRAKLALGVTQQVIDINGSQRLVNLTNGAVQNFQGGLLALNSNIGRLQRDAFSFVPEVTLTAGYHLFDHVKLYAGYNFLYWSNVVRPGDQIDLVLDETRIPNFNTGQVPGTSVRPAVPFKTSDFWAQGLLFGLEVRY